ncbi:glycosyltransferase [Vibrio sp. 10N.222.54.B11]|uniref:glycosyltransferase n=1 Tax=Vibrio sp. 10N.222.54.B11 TaxID=3229635 RepID=UPI00355239AA
MIITLLLPNLSGGGAERVNLDLAFEFKSLGYQVEFVLCNMNGVFLPEAATHFNVVDLNLTSIVQLPRRLAKYIDETKPDAVIASMWGVTAFTPFAKIMSRHKPTILLVEHNSLINQFKNSRKLLKIFLKISTSLSYRLSDQLGGVSLGVTQDMKILANLRNKPVEVLYNPIPSKLTAFGEEEFSKVWGDCSKRVLNVGSYKEQKNQKLLIKAFSMVCEELDAKLIILGEGGLDDELKTQIANLGLEKHVVLHNFVKDPSCFFQSADLFVLSSDREGFGNVIVEALSCGTPVVSTDCEHGPREILNNGEFGTLVPVGDAEALSAAIEESLSKTHDKQKLINRARDFAPEVSAKRYLEVLGLEK